VDNFPWGLPGLVVALIFGIAIFATLSNIPINYLVVLVILLIAGICTLAVALWSAVQNNQRQEPNWYRANKKQNPETATLANSLVNESRANREQDKRKENLHYPIELLTTFAVIVTAGFVISQWYEMREVFIPIDQQAKTLEKTMIASSRAWVAPAQIIWTESPDLGLPAKLAIRIVNVGKEPALGTIWKINPSPITYIPQNDVVEERPVGRNRSCEGLEPVRNTGVVVYPNAANYWLPFDIPNTPENKEIFNAALSRQKTLMIEGCFAYLTFTERHTSAFRFFLRDTAEAPRCRIESSELKCPWNFNAMLSGSDAN
jgi:hypothetical protein